MRRILGHPAVQLGFVVAIGGMVGLSLWKRDRDHIDDRVRYLKSGVQISRSGGTAEGRSAAAMDDDDSGDEMSEETPTLMTATLDPDLIKEREGTEGRDDVSSATPAEDGRAEGASVGSRIILRLTAIEASTRYLQQVLFVDSRQTGQINNIGDYVAGIIPDPARRLSGNNPDLKVLLKEERPIEVGRPLHFFHGVKAGDLANELGLTYHVLLAHADDEIYRAQIEIVRSSKLPGGSGSPPVLQKTPFPADFEVGEEAAFFMTGLMMRGSPPEVERELEAVRPFQILRSGAFRGQVSEFLIFLEFDRR